MYQTILASSKSAGIERMTPECAQVGLRAMNAVVGAVVATTQIEIVMKVIK